MHGEAGLKAKSDNKGWKGVLKLARERKRERGRADGPRDAKAEQRSVMTKFLTGSGYQGYQLREEQFEYFTRRRTAAARDPSAAGSHRALHMHTLHEK